jgi:hypothetical protein
MNLTNKIEIFRSTFQGRKDIVARYWVSKDGKKNGYSPFCRNEWKEGICQKPCRLCSNADYIPLSDELIMDHFRGNHILGIYPLLKDNTCHFVAADFDNHNNDRNPFKDVNAYCEACQVQDVPCYVLRSKSGEGYHVYIFFSAPVPAWKARCVAFALLQEAGVIGDDVKLSSFDRLFPNQDRLSGKGLGNLIALPFQGKAGESGHTLLLDPSDYTKPYTNQWEALSSIKRIDESVLNELIKSWGLEKVRNGNGEGKSINPKGWLLEALKGVKKSDPGRDVTGTKIAGYFIDKLPKQDVLTILLAWDTHNKPPLEEEVIKRIVESVDRYKKGESSHVGGGKIKISIGRN